MGQFPALISSWYSLKFFFFKRSWKLLNYISKRVSIVSMSFEIERIRSINYKNFRLFLMNNKSIPSGLLLSQLLIQKRMKKKKKKKMTKKKNWLGREEENVSKWSDNGRRLVRRKRPKAISALHPICNKIWRKRYCGPIVCHIHFQNTTLDARKRLLPRPFISLLVKLMTKITFWRESLIQFPRVFPRFLLFPSPRSSRVIFTSVQIINKIDVFSLLARRNIRSIRAHRNEIRHVSFLLFFFSRT